MDRSALAPAGARRMFRADVVAPAAGWSAGFAHANLIAAPAADPYDVPTTYRAPVKAGAD